MLTIFSTCKPFEGHSGIIQRNAIASWLRLAPGIEVILFGDDPGVADVARDLGICHVPRVETNSHGTPYLSSLFGLAQKMARHDWLCYVNCDIMLTSDFVKAANRVTPWRSRVLMAGRRRNVDITEPWDFAAPDWEERLRSSALSHGQLDFSDRTDYFFFRRGLFPQIPPLAIGRFAWDCWLLWRARANGAALVDATDAILAVHQNHDYGHPQGHAGLFNSEEALRNRRLAGGSSRLFTLDDATHSLKVSGIYPNHFYWLAPWRRRASRITYATWYPLLDATKTFRHRIGLRRRPTARNPE